MGIIENIWDEVAAGPSPDMGSGKLRKLSTKPLLIKDDASESSRSQYQRSLTMPRTPGTPTTPTSPSSPYMNKQSVWRTVFNPGSNLNNKSLGADLFDRPQPNSPTVYDWYMLFAFASCIGSTVEKQGANISRSFFPKSVKGKSDVQKKEICVHSMWELDC